MCIYIYINIKYSLKYCIYFTATQCVPTFVQEIVDVRAVELETVKFDCQFSGTPKPGKLYVSWHQSTP
jgi:hypothetical protein